MSRPDVMSITLDEKRATSSLTNKPISQDQLEHLEHARTLAVISRRERQLKRIEEKAAELRSFLGVTSQTAGVSLNKLIEKYAESIEQLESKHRSKLEVIANRQNELLQGIQSDLKVLRGAQTGHIAATGQYGVSMNSVVSSVPPSRSARAT